MQVFHKLEDVPPQLGPTVVSVGNFDGVHLAHQEVVRRMAESAHALGGKAVVVTFEPHPLRILRPDVAPKLLTPLPVKLQLLEQAGVDAVLVLPFTRDLSLMSAHDFAREVLAGTLHAREVHEGYNFHFGHKAQGNVNTLDALGKETGLRSSRLSRANAARTSRFQQRDSQAHRERRSRQGARAAGTAIQHLLQSRSRPRLRPQVHRSDHQPVALRRTGSADGVYITWLRVGGECFEAVTNVGNRPTFGPDSFAIESHLLNFHPIELLAQTELELIFLKRLRPEIKFPSVEALREQIAKDVHKARRYFHLL